jgi:hypothetical protein
MDVETGRAASAGADALGEEEAAVRQWRLEQFLQLGFGEFQATLLAYSEYVDLGQVRKLVRGGCGLETLLRIVI